MLTLVTQLSLCNTRHQCFWGRSWIRRATFAARLALPVASWNTSSCVRWQKTDSNTALLSAVLPRSQLTGWAKLNRIPRKSSIDWLLSASEWRIWNMISPSWPWFSPDDYPTRPKLKVVVSPESLGNAINQNYWSHAGIVINSILSLSVRLRNKFIKKAVETRWKRESLPNPSAPLQFLINNCQPRVNVFLVSIAVM